MMTPHRTYHKPIIHIPSERVPVVLGLAVLAWLGLYASGYGFWLLVTALERAA